MPFRKNVYILGAGASADAGAPVMDAFLNRIRDLRDMKHERLTKYDLQAFDSVLEYRASLDKAMARVLLDPENIEDLFGMIEMDVGLALRDQLLRQDIIRVISRTLVLCTDKPLKQRANVITQHGEGLTSHQLDANPYSLFLWLITDAFRGNWPLPAVEGLARDSIITFNYDLVLEGNFDGCALTPDYCLPREHIAWEWGKTFPSRIKLLKLHGSLNWFACNKCNDAPVRVVSPSDSSVETGFRPCKVCSLENGPLLVPPTWNKGFAHKLILPVWQAAFREMLEAGRLIIIGYSFPKTDAFFKYLLGLALTLNDRLFEVVVVNRSPDSKERYSQLFPQYFFGRKVRFCERTFLDALTTGEFQRLGARVFPEAEYRGPQT